MLLCMCWCERAKLCGKTVNYSWSRTCHYIRTHERATDERVKKQTASAPFLCVCRDSVWLASHTFASLVFVHVLFCLHTNSRRDRRVPCTSHTLILLLLMLLLYPSSPLLFIFSVQNASISQLLTPTVAHTSPSSMAKNKELSLVSSKMNFCCMIE